MSNVPTIEITAEQMSAKLIDVLTANKIFSSKREARTMISQGAVTVKESVVKEPEFALAPEMFDEEKALLIRKGKKKFFRLIVR